LGETEAIDQEAELREAIGQYITINRNNRLTAKEERLQREPYGRNPDDPEEAPTESRESHPCSVTTQSPANTITSGPSAPPPPPGGSGLYLPPRAKPGAKAVNTGDLMIDIKNALRAGGNLRRAPGMDDKERKARGFTREPDPKESLILKGEEAEAGTDLWKHDLQSYITNLKNLLTIDYHMARILFRIIEKTFITFSAALQMMDLKETVNHETLARIMTECGFYVKYSLLKTEDDEDSQDVQPFREYTTIICPYDLPLHIILKLIRAFIKSNGTNRRGDPLKDSVADLREKQRAAPKDGPATIGVVQGYWRQKEQRQVGKLWE